MNVNTFAWANQFATYTLHTLLLGFASALNLMIWEDDVDDDIVLSE